MISKVNSKQFSFYPVFRITLIFLILLPPSSLHLCNLSQTQESENVEESGSTAIQERLHQSAPLLDIPFPVPSTKSIKTPTGTVKCSCQTVNDEGVVEQPEPLSSGDGKTIEIEIYKPPDDPEVGRDENESEVKVKRKPIKNSFTLEDEDEGPSEESSESEDRLFSTEVPSFLSFLSSYYNDENFGSQLRPVAEAKDELDENQPVLYPSGSYKAFRSSELNSHKSSTNPDHSTKPDESNKNAENHRAEGEEAPYFKWDFIYGHDRPVIKEKKREFLYLGSIIDSFKGPRRRKRRRRALIGDRGNKPVVFVYPVGYQEGQQSEERNETENQSTIMGSMTKENKVIQVRSDEVPKFDADELKKRMDEAMQRAWVDYGTDGIYDPTKSYVPPPPPPPPEKVKSAPSSNHQPGDSLVEAERDSSPMDVALPHYQQIAPNHVQHFHYRPPRPFLYIDRIFNPFQPMNSEWDNQVKVIIGKPPPPPEPGPFSRFMASYIDFEVNNHETADLMRKVVFALFVGFLIAGWIFLGVILGIIPLKKWLAYHTPAERLEKGKEFMTRDTTISDLTDKILLSLDAEWLKRLEERVMGNGGVSEKLSGNGKKFPVQVFCCILPDEQTNGMVECQVTKANVNSNSKKNNKKSAFKCISDLIYNFQFGPKEDGVEVESDNVFNRSFNN